MSLNLCKCVYEIGSFEFLIRVTFFYDPIEFDSIFFKQSSTGNINVESLWRILDLPLLYSIK